MIHFGLIAWCEICYDGGSISHLLLCGSIWLFSERAWRLSWAFTAHDSELYLGSWVKGIAGWVI